MDRTSCGADPDAEVLHWLQTIKLMKDVYDKPHLQQAAHEENRGTNHNSGSISTQPPSVQCKNRERDGQKCPN